MRVEVHNGNIDRALRVLGKKMKNEGIWDDLKKHRYYEKPSVKRREKRLRKRLG
mgnify:CR=1 FL=1|tara:strand:- start:370 stop:531 length:162 start_codon:yes stop_codon:yes gene_type:complete